LNLQAGQKAIRAIARGEMRTTDCIMATPRGGDTEPTRGSVECVRPAMDTGEVGMMRDAVTVIGETETYRVRHERTTEKLGKVAEKLTVTETPIKETNEHERMTEMKTETQRETQELKEITETREMEQVEGNELNETKDKEHTHVELVRDNEVEHGECFVTQCEQQDSLLKEQREKIRSLEADRDEVSPVGPNEIE